jgi:hypothetical protein
MHRVARGAQLTGETADGTGEPERVVEDDDLGHRPSINTISSNSRRRAVRDNRNSGVRPKKLACASVPE